MVKATVSDLAIFGGSVSFQRLLHVGRPNIGEVPRFMERVADMLDRKWLTNHGPLAQAFERRLAEFTGVKHCIVLTNATVGLEIATRAAGFTGEVIVPSFTFIAAAHALQWQGVTPVFCDVSADSHTLDPTCIERLITPRTTGIIGVHLWGRSCNIPAIEEVAHRHGLSVIYDAAHAFGCTFQTRSIGQYGTATVLSFHATKFLNAFEGGAVLTNDDELAQRIRLMSNFGFSDVDQVDEVGTNGKMSEVSAAMGLTSLDSIDYFLTVNRRNYELYRTHLANLSGIRMLEYDETERNNYQYIVIEVDASRSGISRDLLHKVLQKEGVLARRYFYPGCHNAQPYRSLYPHAHLLLPVTQVLGSTVLALPTGTDVGPKDVIGICGLIRFALRHAKEIRERSSLDVPPRETGRSRSHGVLQVKP